VLYDDDPTQDIAAVRRPRTVWRAGVKV
jgi:hypothetical protein